MKEQYLGDSVYVKFDGYQLILYTSNGIEIQNEIYLEPRVLKILIDFIETLKNKDLEDE